MIKFWQYTALYYINLLISGLPSDLDNIDMSANVVFKDIKTTAYNNMYKSNTGCLKRHLHDEESNQCKVSENIC